MLKVILFFSVSQNPSLPSTLSSQASRYGRNSIRGHTYHQMTNTILFFMYMYMVKRIQDLTFSLKSSPDRYGALKGFLECLPLSKPATLRQSNNLSNIVTNHAVSSTSSFPVRRRAVALVLLSTCKKKKIQVICT